MPKEIHLSTTDDLPWLHNRAFEIKDVICVEYHGIKQVLFTVAKDLLRQRAAELDADLVIGITFEFDSNGSDVRAIGTVIKILR